VATFAWFRLRGFRLPFAGRFGNKADERFWPWIIPCHHEGIGFRPFFCAAAFYARDTMSRKLSGMLILCVGTLCLSGCGLLRITGPCYGVGCPAGAPGRSGQEKLGQAPKAQNAAVPGQTAVAQSAAAPSGAAGTPAAPAPEARAEAKAPANHPISNFFSRLIPHHNSTPKPAAPAD
jgi:hypothetical protein